MMAKVPSLQNCCYTGGVVHKETRPVLSVGRELDAIANLGAHLEGWAQALSPGQVAALGREITELARAVNQHLWS